MQASKGIYFMLGATLCFSLLSAIVKYMSHIPANELMLFRTIISIIITLFQLRLLSISPWGNQKKLLFLRGIFGSIALITFFISVQKMPLATTAILSYTTPIFTTIIGVLFLGERVLKLQWACFLLSFIGIIVIKGFDSDISIFYFFLGIVSALSSAIVYNLISKVRANDHPLVIVFYFPLVGFPFMLIWTFFNWVMPQGMDWILILAIGLLTQLGQILMTKSLQIESLSRASSIQFLGIISSLLIGFFIFNESFTIMNILGIVLVASGVLSNIFISSKQQKHELAN
ncbi:MAG: DMT family transporter [Bacteroidetes bacterium]|jgi:drug/metabolite transporter (DMT)-like permease|nr:DMT family transporter [Bacteroidota bacterium]MBP7255647.1 DMT family transporter [Chitinophagales bacterium]MBK7504596.1 DMT family transporter [Bacteroidota bacterium]MBK7640121.1 DMT family transporter [Bacteroidota bacterium]MBK8671538.1 DMT family transporter [Bacteroidota bacterium]